MKENNIDRFMIERELKRLTTLPDKEYGEWSCGQQDADQDELEFSISEAEHALSVAVGDTKLNNNVSREDYHTYMIDLYLEEAQRHREGGYQ